MEGKFNPSDHLTDIEGKQYLGAKWRLVWFREEKPNWSIKTEIIDRVSGGAIVKAQILNENGGVMAEAHKMETKEGFADYLEKAETGAISRALAMCGFGTQFTDDFAEGEENLADAPVGKTVKAAQEKLGGYTITNPDEPASEKQMNLLQIQYHGRLFQAYRDMFGKPLSEDLMITKGEASKLIDDAKRWNTAQMVVAPKSESATMDVEEPLTEPSKDDLNEVLSF